MAVKPFSKDQLNFFKFSTLVHDEFPKVLRHIFMTMWESKFGSVWDDSAVVLNMLRASESGKAGIPYTKSIKEWDSTALFRATIYAKTFGVPSSKGSTLNDLYLKKSKPAPGSFHVLVQSSTGNQDETYALAIDQLRLLRNTLCHSSKPEIVKPDFDAYVQLVKNALTALNVDTRFVDVIGQMSEDDFPTEKIQELDKFRVKELQANSKFCENVKQELSSLNTKMDIIISNTSLGQERNVPENVPRGGGQMLAGTEESSFLSSKMNSSKDHNNWITIGEVINLIKKPVALYTSHIVERWHVTLCKDFHPFGRCPNPGHCQTKRKAGDLCPSCNEWYKMLAKSHRNNDERKIKWRENCDTSMWPVDSWEVAKFFMPILGGNKGTTKDAESTDLSSLLNVLIWMKDKAFAPERRVDLNLVNKLRLEVRSPWAHAPNQELSDVDLKNAFDIANKFVADLDNVFNCKEVRKCTEDIKFVQTYGISNVVEAVLGTNQLKSCLSEKLDVIWK